MINVDVVWDLKGGLLTSLQAETTSLTYLVQCKVQIVSFYL